MRTLRAITHWIAASLMVVALVVAPPLSAFANCLPQHEQSVGDMDGMSATSAAAPCDTPCDGCPPSDAKKSCLSECVCAPMTALAAAPGAPFASLAVLQIGPGELLAAVGLARPPDTPPPKSLA
jgi:hypothetical protein